MGVAGQADLISLVDDFRQAGDNVDKVAADLVRRTAERTQTLAKEKAPRRTGNLANSIRIRYVSPLEAQVGPSAIYGVYQEYGTGSRGEFGGTSYQIKPKNKPALTFKTKDGRWVSVRVVNHPGIPPRPFMRPALEEALGSYQRELANAGALMITRGQYA